MSRRALLILTTITVALVVSGGVALAEQIYCEPWEPCEVVGTDEDDFIRGSNLADILSGAGGDDDIEADDGEDELYGGEGADSLTGAAYVGDAVTDTIYGEGGNDDASGGEGDDYLDGGDGDDWLGESSINGGAIPTGSDTMYGRAGDDTLLAGTDGRDTVYGGEGSDWGDVLDNSTDDAHKDTVDCGPGVDRVLFDQDADGNEIDTIVNCELLEITELKLEDPVYNMKKPTKIVSYAPLEFLSADAHPYFGSETHIPGSISFSGRPGEMLTSVELEVLVGGAVKARGYLSPAADTALLNKPFPASGVLSAAVHPTGTKVSTTKPLFTIPSAQLAALDTTANRTLTLRVKATMADDAFALQDTEIKEYADATVQQLVLFEGARYGSRRDPRDTYRGGDGWTLPSVRKVAEHYENQGVSYNDFSDMNAGSFRPDHSLHTDGTHIDGLVAGYLPRNAATARKIIRHLNDAKYGRRISRVYVTFNAPGAPPLTCEDGTQDTDHSDFWRAIQDVTLRDGRPATGVIRASKVHCNHFHWVVTPN